jgi:hypothetical protein
MESAEEGFVVLLDVERLVVWDGCVDCVGLEVLDLRVLLDVGERTDEEPEHEPKPLWHPVEQYCEVEPHQPYLKALVSTLTIGS